MSYANFLHFLQEVNYTGEEAAFGFFDFDTLRIDQKEGVATFAFPLTPMFFSCELSVTAEEVENKIPAKEMLGENEENLPQSLIDNRITLACKTPFNTAREKRLYESMSSSEITEYFRYLIAQAMTGGQYKDEDMDRLNSFFHCYQEGGQNYFRLLKSLKEINDIIIEVGFAPLSLTNLCSEEDEEEEVFIVTQLENSAEFDIYLKLTIRSNHSLLIEIIENSQIFNCQEILIGYPPLNLKSHTISALSQFV
jgi:hypothetical protein